MSKCMGIRQVYKVSTKCNTAMMQPCIPILFNQIIYSFILNQNKMEKLITFRPAFDKTNSETSKNYGIHCMDMFIVLKGELGAISFTIYTGWYLKHCQVDGLKSRGASICYHSPTPIRDDEEISEECCEWINKPCYCDCTYSGADDLFEEFVRLGEEHMWKSLEDWYINKFGELR